MTASAPASERIAVVDVLRAFALFGIIITHSAGGFLAGPPPMSDFMLHSGADRLVKDVADLLCFGKFFTIFAFLFGLSFAIQLDSARRKGRGFAGRFTWRLLLLLGIGFVHQLFYSGDILMIYAALGLLLIPFHLLGTRILLVLALILVLNIPGMLLNLNQLNAPPPTAEQQQAGVEAGKQFRQSAQRQYDIKSSGTLSELVKMNVTESFQTKIGFQIFTGRAWITFGLFLLGICAGRANIFRESAEHRVFFSRLAAASGTVAALTTAVELIHPLTFAPRSLADVLSSFSFSVQQFSLAAFYASVVTLLFWRTPTGLLSHLAPMGKMGLTTYLAQTGFGAFVFLGIGLGLMGKLGVAVSVALGIAFFVLQIFISKWWMRHFAMGPVEWLWRTLTYFKLQPMARPATGAA
jgi:uncharacterized protein